MYLGRIVEEGPVKDIYHSAHHPYTQALLSASPSLDPAGRRQRIVLEGDIPSPMDPPSGCHFRTRCRSAMDVCAVEDPAKTEVGPLAVWCHLLDQVVETGTVPRRSASRRAQPEVRTKSRACERPPGKLMSILDTSCALPNIELSKGHEVQDEGSTTPNRDVRDGHRPGAQCTGSHQPGGGRGGTGWGVL